MEDYKPNSNKYREQQAKDIKKEPTEKQVSDKKIEKVVSSTVKTKKRSKIVDNFVSQDINNVKDYVFMDVLIPAAKKAISDIVSNGIEMILYGEVTPKSSKGRASKIRYGSYYDRRDPRDERDRRESRQAARSGYDYDDIIIDNRGEAESVLERMDELLDVYGSVSVADFYDLVGVRGRYTDNKYGWVNLKSAYVTRAGGGYVIKLPKALPLD